MKPKLFLFLLAIALLSFSPSKEVNAQYIQSHVGVQLDISQNQNTRQNSDIEMQSDPSCSGNTISSTSTQTNIGGRGASQNQRTRHFHRSSQPNPSGVDAPTIQNRVVIPVPVETPDTPVDFP